MRFETGHHAFVNACRDCRAVLSGDTTSIYECCDTPQEAKKRIEVIEKALRFLSDQYGFAENLNRTDEFSAEPCECCGSHLAGARYEIVFITLEIDEESSEDESSEDESETVDDL